MNSRLGGTAPHFHAVRFAKLRICFAALASLPLLCAPARASDACASPMARVASVQGTVEVRHAERAWQAARLEQALCAGDAVRVGERSRAALLMNNQTTLRLDQHSHLTLRAPDAPRGTVIEQLRGIVNVITRTPQPFRLSTPFVNANVEGTEFLVQVGESASSVLVVEGRVVASNEAGRVTLQAGEQASGDAVTLPRKTLVLRPRNAVQWAVHYPTVRPRVGADLPAVRAAAALAARGRMTEALAGLDAQPVAQRTGGLRLQRAALLLDVGRADQALPDLQAIEAGDPAHAESLALQAMVALVHNQPEGALALSQQAVAADARSTAALLAASYVHQSRFELDQATTQAAAAARLEPDNALAWARLAELHLHAGRLVEATAAAGQAVAQGPALSRAQLVQGFTLLAHGDNGGARQAFEHAVQLDQADPLPRMGLGLVHLREGRRTEGREQIDIAVSLDPDNALLRSYLGRVYAQERRGPAAETQFRLARERDPLDPTPWFYEALYKLVNNRPVEALDDMARSIALNDNRAVVRSRLLLDDDRAERSVALARIQDELGFGRLGIAQAAQALAIDPGTAAAHRFLADAYSGLDRHEAAVSSENLQALLLQPVRPAHLLPHRSSTGVMGLVDESALGMPADESRYFERQGASGRLGLAAGSRGLWSAEASGAYAGDRLALDAGSFRYHTEGFRPNSPISHQVDDVLLQWQLTPGLQLQGQLRSRRSRYGDVRSAFGVESTAPGEHNTIEDRSARLGLAWRPSGQEVVLVSYVRQHEEESVLLPGRTRVLAIEGDTPGHVLEAQYQRAVAGGHWLLGVARTRSTSQLRLRRYDPALPVPSGPCRMEAPCLTDDRQALNQDQAYAYWQQPLGDTLQGTLGLARLVADEPAGLRHLWLPKLGLLWRPTPEATVRAAAFRTLRRAAEFDQSIEPTSVVGFNQIYDDGNSVASVVHALGADVALSPGLKLSAAWTARRVSVPGPVTTSGQGTVDELWNEQQTRTELFWTPHPRIAVRGGLVLDRFWRHPLYQIPMLLNLRTASVPLAVRYFLDDGWFGEAAWTTVAQRVHTPAGMNMPEGFDRFRLVDLVLGRHAGASPTTVTLTVKNPFGQRFRFQDDSFRSGDVRLARYLPARSVVLAVQTVF